MKYELLEDALSEVEAACPVTITVEELAQWHDTAHALIGYAKRLRDAADLMLTVAAEAVPKGSEVVSEGRTFKRSATPKRVFKPEANDDMLRAVLDSRRIAPPRKKNAPPLVVNNVTYEPGDVIEETLVDKLRHVYPMPARDARTRALAARLIDLDQFCTTEFGERFAKEVLPGLEDDDDDTQGA